MAIGSSDPLGTVAARLIQNVPFFKGLKPAELFEFLAKAKQAAVRNGQVIFSEGGEGDHAMYIIVKGAVEIVKTAPDGAPEIVGTLEGGQCFGEMALADRQPRSATATAKADGVVLSFTGDFLSAFPHIAFRLYENLGRIIAGRFLDMEQQMRGIMQPCCKVHCVDPAIGGLEPITGQIGPRGMEALAQLGGFIDVPAGEYVVRQNTVGQYMYVLFEGGLEVSQIIEDAPVRIALLAPGNYFGETALASGEHRRLADVRAVDPSRVLRLNYASLLKSPHVGAVIYKELGRIFSMRMRRSTLVYVKTIGRGCHKGCSMLRR